MAGRDGKYPNAKVGFEQGAERLFVDSDGYFNFYSKDVSGAALRNVIYTRTQGTIMINSAGVLSDQGDGTAPPILPSLQRVIVFSFTDAASNASARLCSGFVGQELTLMTRGGGSTGSIVIYCSGHASGISGVVVVGLLSGELSSITMRNSAASTGMVKLVCTTDGTWAVVDFIGTNITLRPAS